MSDQTGAEFLDTAVALACEKRNDPTREEVDHLLDRSREHDRRLAQIDERFEQSAEDLAERLRPHAEQLTALCDKWAFVSDTLAQQAREIERLNAALQARGSRVTELPARDGTVAASSPAEIEEASTGGPLLPEGPGRLLYWFCCGVAVASLVGGIGLMTKFLYAAPANAERSFLPLVLIGVSIVAALATLVLGRMLARQQSETGGVVGTTELKPEPSPTSSGAA